MVKRYLSAKFFLALICLTGSEKTVFTEDGRTDGRWTTDAHVTTVALLCSSTKQS